jgi:hypothetical protein
MLAGMQAEGFEGGRSGCGHVELDQWTDFVTRRSLSHNDLDCQPAIAAVRYHRRSHPGDLDSAEVALFPFAAYKRADVLAFASR